MTLFQMTEHGPSGFDARGKFVAAACSEVFGNHLGVLLTVHDFTPLLLIGCLRLAVEQGKCERSECVSRNVENWLIGRGFVVCEMNLK